jgi:alkanesulfonate monooxygenase SsuD/methylene tetrahydromethanopterin reductase-like flavin-dependent oxidoreductase (luciferase family)
MEFPAYGLEHSARAERFSQALSIYASSCMPVIWTSTRRWDVLKVPSSCPSLSASIPMMVTGSSGQSLEWIAEHADGWLTYPNATHTPRGPQHLAEKIRAWRELVPGGAFRPHMTNEWIDLVDDPGYPRLLARWLCSAHRAKRADGLA